MSLILILALVVVLAIVLSGIWFAVKEFSEFEHIFNYGILVMLLLIVGAAVYMAFASPSLATRSNTPTAGTVTEQESNLLQE